MSLDLRGVSIPRRPGEVLADTRERSKQLEQRTPAPAPAPGFCITCTLPTYTAGDWTSTPWFPVFGQIQIVGLLVWSAGGEVNTWLYVDGDEVATCDVTSGTNFVAVPSAVLRPFRAMQLDVVTYSTDAFQAQILCTGPHGGGHLNLLSNIIEN